jgi:alkaline phosphatase D
VTRDSAEVFVRTDSEAEVQIRYGTEPDLSDGQESSVSTVAAWRDYTTQISLTSLDPSTTYYLDVLVNGQSQLTPPYPQFKTFPPFGVSTPFKFVVLTDFKRADSDRVPDTPVFREASNERPDFVYIGGDFDHRDPTSLAEKRQMFKDLYTPANDYEDFVFEILRRYAMVHNWDDHDYASDNADRTYPYKARSLRVLKEYFPVYPCTQYGDWQKFSYGHVDFFLLDSRSQRDPWTDPQSREKSMLDGDDLDAAGQLWWLKRGLRSSAATWKFILTPVVFNPTNPVLDSWSGCRHERRKIVNFVQRSNIKGVILISGDRHAGAVDDGTNSGFPEMLVPAANMNSCNSTGSANLPLGIWSEGTYGGEIPPPSLCRGYGVVTVLTNPDRVILEVKDEYGTTQVSHTVTLPDSPVARSSSCR